ncbi:FeoA family protein [Fervidibacillus albus]|uniref:Ferrous iron transport protein A n=1 Tax=Fervidibacillus albus TaxID=2980026 RepID=A0A9E8LWT8_9BACI|nr:FeoA family protein [Fervidibacillus albus]WAA10912.1 ferrous iron transport protein A [Fervidibacillus albus]
MAEKQVISLDQAQIGDCIEIKKIGVTGTMRRRLLDLGFVPSAKVIAIQKSPLGDPIAYQVSQTIIALRKEESSKIFGEIVKNDSKSTD